MIYVYHYQYILPLYFFLPKVTAISVKTNIDIQNTKHGYIFTTIFFPSYCTAVAIFLVTVSLTIFSFLIYITYQYNNKMATSNESFKKNWLIQINDLTDQQIKKVTHYIGGGSGINQDLGIHHATVAMYLGYKYKGTATEEPKITKNLKVTVFSIVHFFPYF